jgi:hydroxymethylbilane synthase
VGALGRIVLGSRGSDLALAQARLVEQALRTAWPALEIVIEVIRTRGDERAGTEPVADRKAGRKGLFTREIEQALLARQIDVAIHSAKDLPSERLDELELRATLPRTSTEDVLITKTGGGLATIASGGVIGTGSVRRQHQLGWKRPDLQTADLRGNVPTRLRKLRETESWSGIILARAGLERLGLEVAGEILSPDDFVPAGGQGVIALQVRRDNACAQQLIDAVNDQTTLVCLRAEREFLRLLDGDCDSPVGVHARIAGREMVLQAQVFTENEKEPQTGRVQSAAGREKPEVLSSMLHSWMYGKKQSR